MIPVLQLVSFTFKETMVLLKESGGRDWPKPCSFRCGMEDMQHGRASLAGKDVMQELCGPGQVPCQWGVLVN